ncbi:MAG: hypothetical protein ACREGG_01975 [Candidatus Saccharimonadales bacterium]
MTNQKLNDLVDAIDRISVMFSGSMSSDGYGGRSSQQEAVYALKCKMAALKAEALKEKPDKKSLENLVSDVEGALLGVNSLSIINNSTLGKLVAELHSLDL